jgi:ribosomal protein S18 acetylase RimI-like enzyme
MGRHAASHHPSETDDRSTTSHNPSAQGPAASVINRKANHAVQYALRPPRPSGSGWQIDAAAQGVSQPVASVQLTPSENGVYISNLKVAPEHRRHGLAAQLIDAALRTARSNGHQVAQLEARPDSAGDVGPAALVSMYRKLGFSTTGISKRGNPLMERRTC